MKDYQMHRNLKLSYLFVFSILCACIAPVTVLGTVTEDTTVDILEAIKQNGVQQKEKVIEDYNEYLEAYEKEKQKVQSDEQYIAFFDAALLYQEEMREENSRLVQKVIEDNNSLKIKIEENILGDLTLLKNTESQIQINLGRIEDLLSKSNKYVLPEERVLDISLLSAMQEELEKLVVDDVSSISGNLTGANISVGVLKDLQYPVIGYKPSSVYGDRLNRVTLSGVEFNDGYDFDVPAGTSVISVFSGRVASIGETYTSGKYITIDIGGGLSLLYTHLKKISVGVGDEITQYDVIGTSGELNSKIEGVHLAMYLNGIPIDLSVLY